MTREVALAALIAVMTGAYAAAFLAPARLVGMLNDTAFLFTKEGRIVRGFTCGAWSAEAIVAAAAGASVGRAA